MTIMAMNDDRNMSTFREQREHPMKTALLQQKVKESLGGGRGKSMVYGALSLSLLSLFSLCSNNNLYHGHAHSVGPNFV